MKICMQQIIKRFLGLVLLVSCLPAAWGFSPGGPVGNNPKPILNVSGDSWQTPAIGYGLPGDVLAPKNLGQEYRRNTPVLYYTYDENYFLYFDANNTTNGTAAIDSAFTILNNLTNVNNYSPDLSEFPLNAQKYNYTAQALGLIDLKSSALSLMMEQLGLADPLRYVWTLHDRFLPDNGTCPIDEEYVVIQRNFDPVSDIYSSYVNGTLFTYEIEEFCNPPIPPDALAVPFPVDETADSFSAVASLTGISGGLSLGAYYTGLTRDDVGGLRYLISTNNILNEDPAGGSLLLTSTTNLDSILPFPSNPNFFVNPTGFGTFDLGALLSASVTNDPVTLQALFPGVIVSSTTTNLARTTNLTLVAYFTNFPASPFGSAPTLIIATNATPSFEIVYSDTFANIVTNHYSPNTVVTLQHVTIGPLLSAPFGSGISTNTTSQTVTLLGVPSGDYYIIPTNNCGLDIQSVYFTNVVMVTNISSLFGTNVATATSTNNTGGTTIQFAQVVFQQVNYVFAIHPVTCTQTPAATGLYAGVGKIQFIRADFDSLIGQTWNVLTNTYTVVGVTNSQYQSRTFQRVVTQPDILFSAGDLTAPLGSLPAGDLIYFYDRTDPNWDQNNAGNGLAGPGTINPANPSTTVIFNNVGDVFINGSLASFNLSTNQFLRETNQKSLLAWGSFNGSTNPPVVYPDSAALTNLENQIIIQISPGALPEGTNGVAYKPTAFTTTGGAFTAPFTWSALPEPGEPGSGLPSGLILSSAGVIRGTPSGDPSGTYDFVVKLTDQNGRSVQWNYSINIQ
jgi:Putative Ig domain